MTARSKLGALEGGHRLTLVLERPRLDVAAVDSCDNLFMGSRFLTLAEVQDVLNVSSPQAYALVRGGELRAIQVGGRGQWRIERTELERYIEERYAANDARVQRGSSEQA